MMVWEKLLSTKRFGLEEYYDLRKHDRTEYQRDYDRLVFSAPFRRLQNKTQVFPLPGSIFVHNRLTHSLEVSCVGRSLGVGVAKKLREKYANSSADFEEIGSIVAAACLAHDLGNPPFGHSGEKAITSYFKEGNGKHLKEKILSEKACWDDFINFEGNANSFRLLIHQFTGRRRGGFVMTYPTLASIVKYPYSAKAALGKGKFGFFEPEEKDYIKIAEDLGIICLEKNPARYVRYPLVYLVEAADDICYQIMDLEDAHKLHLISTDKIISMLLDFFEGERREKVRKNMCIVSDVNERISYLRSSVIGLLINECSRVFVENEQQILKGQFNKALIDNINQTPHLAYAECTDFAFKNIYRSKDVLDIELAGYRIIGMLLDIFIKAVEEPHQAYSKVILSRIPEQFEVYDKSLYTRILSVLDYISGMTDVYALDLYRKITGMSLPVV